MVRQITESRIKMKSMVDQLIQFPAYFTRKQIQFETPFAILGVGFALSQVRLRPEKCRNRYFNKLSSIARQITESRIKMKSMVDKLKESGKIDTSRQEGFAGVVPKRLRE